jgi:hypothetical protein
MVQAIVAEGLAREGLQEMVLPAEEDAVKRLAAFVSDAAIDRMIADAQDAGISLLDGRPYRAADGQGYRAGARRGNGRPPRLPERRPGRERDWEFPERLLREDDYHDVRPGADFGSAGPKFRVRTADRGERAAARRGR